MRVGFGGEVAVEVGEGALHRDGGEEGAAGGVGLGDGGAEEGHDRVADEFIDDAAVALDFGGHAVEVTVEEREEFAGWESFGEGGEVAKIGEEDGDLAFFAAERGAVAEELGGDFGGDVFIEEIADAVAFGEAGGHGVEGGGEAAEFVGAAEFDAGGVVAAGDDAGVRGEGFDGAAEAAGEGEAEERGDGEAGAGDGEEKALGGVGGAEFFLEGKLERERGATMVAGGEKARGDERRFAGEREGDDVVAFAEGGEFGGERSGEVGWERGGEDAIFVIGEGDVDAGEFLQATRDRVFDAEADDEPGDDIGGTDGDGDEGEEFAIEVAVAGGAGRGRRIEVGLFREGAEVIGAGGGVGGAGDGKAVEGEERDDVGADAEADAFQSGSESGGVGVGVGEKRLVGVVAGGGGGAGGEDVVAIGNDALEDAGGAGEVVGDELTGVKAIRAGDDEVGGELGSGDDEDDEQEEFGAEAAEADHGSRKGDWLNRKARKGRRGRAGFEILSFGSSICSRRDRSRGRGGCVGRGGG